MADYLIKNCRFCDLHQKADSLRVRKQGYQYWYISIFKIIFLRNYKPDVLHQCLNRTLYTRLILAEKHFVWKKMLLAAESWHTGEAKMCQEFSQISISKFLSLTNCWLIFSRSSCQSALHNMRRPRQLKFYRNCSWRRNPGSPYMPKRCLIAGISRYSNSHSSKTTGSLNIRF